MAQLYPEQQEHQRVADTKGHIYLTTIDGRCALILPQTRTFDLQAELIERVMRALEGLNIEDLLANQKPGDTPDG